MNKKQNIIVFDADGVLLNNELGGLKDILMGYFGKEKEVLAIHEEYEKRKHLGPWGLEQMAELYKNLTVKEVEQAAIDYVRKYLMKGVKEAIDCFKEKGYLVASLSSNPIFIMEALKDVLGLDFVAGNVLEMDKEKYTGKLLEKVDRFVKKEILQKVIDDYCITGKVVVVGDSITDLPMAELATKFIAFNTDKKEVTSRANFVIKEKDLIKISELNI